MLHPHEVTCASIILYNTDKQILFHLRDNIPTIAYPNYWAIPGGHVEAGETPHAAMQRELMEELAYNMPMTLWKTYDFWRTSDTIVHQYVYVAQWNDAPTQVTGYEGQAWKWMQQQDIETYPIAFGFDILCQEFWQHILAKEDR